MNVDVVVVGAGSSGIALACRLSEDPGRSVLLLEAGLGAPLFSDADLLSNVSFATTHRDWALRAQVSGGRELDYPQGKFVGGGSSVNGALAFRGAPEDFEGWLARGNPSWGWPPMLAAYRRLEHDLDFGPPSVVHGDDGPVPIVRWHEQELVDIQRAFRQACLGQGYPWTDDHNDPASTGIGSFPMNRSEGRRMSTALTYLEAAALGLPKGGRIDVAALERAVDRAAVRYDRDGDQHYDVISAFIKSMRGSDVDAALHYLARMIAAGEDPRFIARRLVVHASEDVGMADPTALQTAVAAAQAVELVGLPEARINLAQAVIHISLAPKSNAVIKAIGAADADVRAGLVGAVPAHLRDAHYPGAGKVGHGEGYLYPHDFDGGIVSQRYAPDSVADRTYYEPSGHGAEARIAERAERIRAVLRRAKKEQA